MAELTFASAAILRTLRPRSLASTIRCFTRGVAFGGRPKLFAHTLAKGRSAPLLDQEPPELREASEHTEYRAAGRVGGL